MENSQYVGAKRLPSSLRSLILNDVFLELRICVINHISVCACVTNPVSALFSRSANTSWQSTCVRPWVWPSRTVCLISRCPHCSVGLQPCDTQVHSGPAHPPRREMILFFFYITVAVEMIRSQEYYHGFRSFTCLSERHQMLLYLFFVLEELLVCFQRNDSCSLSMLLLYL